MANDRTWDDVAAGVERRCLHDAQNRPFIFHIASALREAHEAGLRERIDVIDCDACGERHLTERGAAIVAENRSLRRELRALALVMAWLDEDNRHVDCYGGEWSVWEDEPMPDGTGWIEGGPAKAAGRTMTALAAALGLEVEDD